MGPEFAEVEVTERVVLSDAFRTLEKIGFRQVDGGEQLLEREVYHNGPGAAVLPIDPERGTVLLVRQLRLAALVNGDHPFLVEACAGIVDDGDDPAVTVAKEAEQELGYRLHDLRPQPTLYMSPGSTSERLHLFLARYAPGDRIGAGGGLDEEGEDIRILEPPLSEAEAMTRDGRIIDAKTVLLLRFLRDTFS